MKPPSEHILPPTPYPLRPSFRPLLTQFAVVCSIFFIAVSLIAYGRGYRLDINKKSLTPTGLLVATSDPTGSELLVDNKLVTATNATINLSPNWYSIKIIKEGYIPWEKQIRVQGEILARADATLFPSNPSLASITTTGVSHPSVSPDGTKLAYVVPNGVIASDSARIDEKRAGIYVLDLVDKPLSLLNRDARRIVSNEILDWSNALLAWSPDSKRILAILNSNPTTPYSLLPTPYLLDSDRLNNTARPVNDTKALETEWEDLEKTKQKEKLGGLKESLLHVATSSMNIIAFSPDETKILYEASISGTIPQIVKPSLIGTNPTKEDRVLVPKHLYVYDIKEDKNYPLGKSSDFTINVSPTAQQFNSETMQQLNNSKTKQSNPLDSAPNSVFSIQYSLSWLPTSLHLVVATPKGIDIMEYDGGNRATVYAGPFLDGFVTPWATGMKLVILTNLNPTASSLPNLYSVNLR